MQKIEHRREAYKKILEGQDNLWEEYSKLRREVNNLVVQKKLEVWNEVVERANSDFEGNRKEFWTFVGRMTMVKRRGVTALRNSAGVSVTSMKGKLEVLIISSWALVVLIQLLMIVGRRKCITKCVSFLTSQQFVWEMYWI